MADSHSSQSSSDDTYHPKDAVGGAIKATGVTSLAGLFMSAVQNTLTRQNVGAFGIFTRTGGTIAVFGAMGGAYEFTKNASANLREKDDAWNSAWGGLMAGSMLGLSFRSSPAVLGYGGALAVLLGTFTYTGGRLGGFRPADDVDEVARKEYLRKTARVRPVEETLNQLGEGRGIYGEGYQARRAERLKEAYGVDVPSRTAA